MTDYINKFLLTVPAADCPALNAWVRANIDPTGSDWFVPNLSADGRLPATHARCCFHATSGQTEQWAAFLDQYTATLNLQGITDIPRAAQEARLDAYTAELQADKGIALDVAFNDAGQQPEPDAGLVAVVP